MGSLHMSFADGTGKTFAQVMDERRVEMVQRYKRIEEAAWRWEMGQMSDERLAQLVFGMVNRDGR